MNPAPVRYGDHWYLPITPKQAYDLRFDVPIYARSPHYDYISLECRPEKMIGSDPARDCNKEGSWWYIWVNEGEAG